MRRLLLAQPHLAVQRVRPVLVHLPREGLDLALHGGDAGHGVLVRLVDGAEVAELRVGLADVAQIEEHVEHAVAVALVHGREARAAQRLRGVELRPGRARGRGGTPRAGC